MKKPNQNQLDLFSDQPDEHSKHELETKNFKYKMQGRDIIIINKKSRLSHRYTRRGAMHECIKDDLEFLLSQTLKNVREFLPGKFFRSFLSEAEIQREYQQINNISS